LQLVKVEDGLMGGNIMFHEFVTKTEEEKAAISKMRNQKKYASLSLFIGLFST